MNKQQAIKVVKDTFESDFEKVKFSFFIKNLLNHYEESYFSYQGQYIIEKFRPYISKLERIGKYTDGKHKIDLLIVKLKKSSSLERARSMQRNFIAHYLKDSRGGQNKKAALVAFVSPNEEDWRFSLVNMDYRFEEGEKGKVGVKEEFTSARRWSFLVGRYENSHTAQSRFMNLIADDEHDPTLEQLEEAFNIEKVTKEFFEKYRGLFLRVKEELDKIVASDENIRTEFEEKGVNTVDFSKKLLGQIVFLYFLQKKGWFGIARDAAWGSGPKNFLRELFLGKHRIYGNYFNEILEPLFYEALRYDRRHDDNYYSSLNCKIPFLNGGLFDPINDYDWAYEDINLPNELFSNNIKTKEGDIGNGILDIFDRFNFTVKEDEPLDKEVAIDPEMLGKVFENLLEIKDRKSKGTYYTPREIVHYMCQQSLINYLFTELNNGPPIFEKVGDDQLNILGNETKQGQLDIHIKHQSGTAVPKENIEFLIIHGDEVSENEAVVEDKGKETKTYSYKIGPCIRNNADLIDQKLAGIKVCDPAVGSGAFLVSMMTEIVKARKVLSHYIKSPGRNIYRFKRECIEKCLYGVDIDPGAVEIAKLRLWLSLIVEEEDINKIRPLPNLNYKIVCGNSLLGVVKNLFNNALFIELEKIKPLYFDETNPSKKQEYKNKIDDLINQITNGHKEFDFEIYFSEVFHEGHGFDVVIANPPYLGEKGNKEIFRKVKQSELRQFYLRKMDLFYFFLHLALNIGKENSQISFITTNYYLTADGAKKLRKDVRKRSNIIKLIDFNELKIFKSASGQHNILTFLTKTNDTKNVFGSSITVETCRTKKIGGSNSKILTNILDWNDKKTDYFSFPLNELFDGSECYIRLEGTGVEVQNPINNSLNKIKSQGENLGDLCKVSQGLLTGVDRITNKHIKANLIEAKYKSSGVYILKKEEYSYLNFNEAEKKLLKHFYKNSDIKKYYSNEKPNYYVLYLTRDLELNNFPNIKQHIRKFEKPIRARSKDRGEIQAGLRLGKWWVIFAAREKQVFSGPKIITPQRSYTNTFAYNEIDWFASADVYFITAKNISINLKYVLCLLNSKLYYLWFYYRGKRKGEMLELFYTPLTETPIKNIFNDEQKPFIEIVDKILAITKDEDYLDNPTKQAKVKTFERDIDQMVYTLYGLTEEEIALVEESVGR